MEASGQPRIGLAYEVSARAGVNPAVYAKRLLGSSRFPSDHLTAAVAPSPGVEPGVHRTASLSGSRPSTSLSYKGICCHFGYAFGPRVLPPRPRRVNPASLVSNRYTKQ